MERSASQRRVSSAEEDDDEVADPMVGLLLCRNIGLKVGFVSRFGGLYLWVGDWKF